MEEILAQLRERGMPCNPPASDVELRWMESELGVELPADVRALYGDHAGNPYSPDWALRLLAPEEAVATTKELLDRDFLFEQEGDHVLPLFEREGFSVFWEDEDGNFVGVFTRGLLEGGVFVLDMGEPWPDPAWANVSSFYRSLLSAPSEEEMDDGWLRTVERDYPRAVDGPDVEADLIAAALFDAYEASPESSAGIRNGLQALSVCSRRHVDRVRPMLGSNSRWLRETAAFALQRFDPDDVDLLVGHLASDDPNTRLQALIDLKRLGDERGLQAAVNDELAHWLPIYVEGREPPYGPSLPELDAHLIEPYLRAHWWTEMRLAHADFAAHDLHSAPGGLGPQEIEDAVRGLGLPAPHIGPMRHYGPRVVDGSPLTLAVTIELWWARGRDPGVADVRMVQHGDAFAVAVDAIRVEPLPEIEL